MASKSIIHILDESEKELIKIIREIIDESDVYIDVHKAIRRLAPAPHARMYKDSTKQTSNTAAESDLIDMSDEPTASDALLSKLKRQPSEQASRLSSSPKTTFLMRRSSNGQDGGAHNPPERVRGNIGDMREHLKHLGPSNLASRPNTTRYQSVKIKPGNPNFASAVLSGENKAQPSSITEERYTDLPAPEGGVGEGLLSGGKDASDGIQALQQGYGTMDQRPLSSKRSDKALVSSDTPLTENNSSKSALERQSSSESSHSSDTLGELKSSDNSPIRKSRSAVGVARSGSITENVVDVGGIRKVILETTSTEELERNATKENTSMGASSSEQGGQSSNSGGQEEGAKKPKRRRPRRKNGKAGGSTGS